MVTTGAGEIAAVANVTAGQRSESGGDASLFAQLLGETVGDVAAVTPASGPASGKPAGSKSTNVGNTVDSAQSVPPDMLALCGIPVTPTPTAPTQPAEVVVDKAEQPAGSVSVAVDVTTQMASVIEPVVMTPPSSPVLAAAQENTDGALHGGDARRSTRAADLRWLARDASVGSQAAVGTARSSVTIDPNVDPSIDPSIDTTNTAPQGVPITQPAVQYTAERYEGQFAAVMQPKQQATEQIGVNSNQRSMTDGAIEMPMPSDGNPLNTEKLSTENLGAEQPAFQKLLAQVTPLMGMISGQTRESGVDQSSREKVVDEVQGTLGAFNAAALQPSGTQLARDEAALEVAPRHHLQAAVGTQQWVSELGNKLTMMAARDTQSATLYMTPADMGPVQVRIELNQDQASVWFTAEHAETRSALEQSLPKLREMFSAQGMSLTDAGVFGDRSRQQQPENSSAAARFHGFQYEDSDTLADTAAVRTISLGLLDAYA